jgi:hypothetical protein
VVHGTGHSKPGRRRKERGESASLDEEEKRVGWGIGRERERERERGNQQAWTKKKSGRRGRRRERGWVSRVVHRERERKGDVHVMKSSSRRIIRLKQHV